jgi:hypothetical protein
MSQTQAQPPESFAYQYCTNRPEVGLSNSIRLAGIKLCSLWSCEQIAWVYQASGRK